MKSYENCIIRIVCMNDNDGKDKHAAAYAGKIGLVTYVDSICQLHGTWGGLAVIPAEDKFEVLTVNDAITGICKGLDVDKVKESLTSLLKAEVKNVDEKIEDCCMTKEDQYVMLRSYDVFLPVFNFRCYCRFFYGNNTKTVADIEIKKEK